MKCLARILAGSDHERDCLCLSILLNQLAYNQALPVQPVAADGVC